MSFNRREVEESFLHMPTMTREERSRMFKKILIGVALLVLLAVMTGCGGLIPADPSKMSPEQLKEFAKDKNANVYCVVANTPYGKQVGTAVVLDKAVIPAGTVVVTNDCTVTITNDVKPK